MDEEIKKLLEITAKNTEEIKKISEDIKKITKGVKNHLIRDEVYSWLKTLLFIVPLIIGAIYLAPFMKQAMTSYQQLLGSSLGALTGNVSEEDMNKVLTPDMLEKIRILQNQENK